MDDDGRKCSECGVSLKTERELQNHMRIHSALGYLKCEKCESVFDERPHEKTQRIFLQDV